MPCHDVVPSRQQHHGVRAYAAVLAACAAPGSTSQAHLPPHLPSCDAAVVEQREGVQSACGDGLGPHRLHPWRHTSLGVVGVTPACRHATRTACMHARRVRNGQMIRPWAVDHRPVASRRVQPYLLAPRSAGRAWCNHVWLALNPAGHTGARLAGTHQATTLPF